MKLFCADKWLWKYVILFFLVFPFSEYVSISITCEVDKYSVKQQSCKEHKKNFGSSTHV